MKKTPEIPAQPGPEKPGRGRPPDVNLRSRILEAAKRLFLQQGVSVSLDRVAEAANTTKMTLYKFFPSKEALLDAALTERFLETFELDARTLDPADPLGVLTKLGLAYLEVSTNEDMLAQILVIYQGAGKEPDIARAAYESGPKKMMTTLAKYLEKVPSLQIPEPLLAAEQFFSMVRGMEQTRTLLRLPGSSPARRRRYLVSSVELFLRGYAAA